MPACRGEPCPCTRFFTQKSTDPHARGRCCMCRGMGVRLNTHLRSTDRQGRKIDISCKCIELDRHFATSFLCVLISTIRSIQDNRPIRQEGFGKKLNIFYRSAKILHAMPAAMAATSCMARSARGTSVSLDRKHTTQVFSAKITPTSWVMPLSSPVLCAQSISWLCR